MVEEINQSQKLPKKSTAGVVFFNQSQQETSPQPFPQFTKGQKRNMGRTKSHTDRSEQKQMYNCYTADLLLAALLNTMWSTSNHMFTLFTVISWDLTVQSLIELHPAKSIDIVGQKGVIL